MIVRACTVAVALLLVFAICFSVWNMTSLGNGSKMRNAVAAETANVSIDGAMFSYFINYNYNSYLNQYGDYLYLLGLDSTVSLKDQAYSNSQTWFDYFASAAQDTAAQYLLLNEAAREANVTLPEDVLEIIARKAADINPESFGRGLNTEDIRRVLEFSTLSGDYYQTKLQELAPTMEEIEEAYATDKLSYMNVDYYTYSFVYATEDDTSDVEKMPQAEAKKWAEELAETTSNDEFVDWVVNYTKKTIDDATQENLDAIPTNLLVTGDSYIEGNEVSTWLFADKTRPGDTYIQHSETNGVYTVYSLRTEAYREEGGTVNVRHILVDTEERANELLAQYQAGEQTERAFGLLAFEFSTDSGSVGTYGLYENVAQGDMVEAFDAWCFEEGRTVGDTGVVKTDYGYHVMLYCGEGLVEWQAKVKTDLVNAAYTTFYEELVIAYPVTFHEEVLSDIPA